jgi:hypothetical protein
VYLCEAMELDILCHIHRMQGHWQLVKYRCSGTKDGLNVGYNRAATISRIGYNRAATISRIVEFSQFIIAFYKRN